MPRVLRILVALVLSVAAAALAQRRFDDFGGHGYGHVPAIHNIPYDGRFTFVRIRYETAPGGYWAGGRPSWIHGYPIAERNLMKIMNEELPGYARRRRQHADVRRSRTLQLPDCLPHRSRLVDGHRS